MSGSIRSGLANATAAASFVLLMCLSVPLAAQFPVQSMEGVASAPARRLIRVGFAGGVSVPADDAGRALQNGINGQAFVLLDPGLGFPLRFNVGYQRFSLDESSLAGLAGQTSILSGVGGLNVNLFQVGPVRPYVMAGLGAFRLNSDFNGDPDQEAGSEIEFGIDGGAGIAIKLGRIDAFIEGRIQNIYTQTGMIDASTIRAIPVSFGILF